MFYNPKTTLSHNCFFNLVVSNRGSGKSYSTLLLAVQNYLKKGQEFVYIRRTQIELDNAKNSLFKALEFNNEIKTNEFITIGNNIYHRIPIDNTKEELNIAGYIIALSKTRQFKSVAYPKVHLIIFDEFIDENGKYLKNECENLLSIIETIARLRKIKVILLGNLITKYNPYFLYFNITFNQNKEFIKDKERSILIHNFKSTEYTKTKKETPFAKLIENTEYGMFILENKNIIDKDDFVRKFKTASKIPQVNFIFEELPMTAYIVDKPDNTFLYIDKGHNKNAMYNLNMDEELRENFKNIKRRNPVSMIINRYARNGQIYFSNGIIKSKIQELIKTI